MTRIVGSLLGHKSRCFDVKVLKYQESTYILSSSEDGTAILWSLSETNLSKKPIFIFKPTGDTEVLRSTFIGNTIERICTCGSDGNITIWRQEVTSKASTISYKIEATLSHGIESQIYACESSVCGSLITAADNCILVWKVGSWSEAPIRYSFADPFTCLLETPRINEVEGTLTYEILNTHKFTSDNSAEVHNENVPFGGSRNADGHLLIFDVKVNPVSTHGVWLALATSSSQVYAIDISMGLLALDGEVEAPDSSIRSNQMFAKSSYSTKIDSASNNYITSVSLIIKHSTISTLYYYE